MSNGTNLAETLAEWRARFQRRFQSVLDLEVPTDGELIAMQQRGELPSDEELARQGLAP